VYTFLKIRFSGEVYRL